jgi:hypothetical protein
MNFARIIKELEYPPIYLVSPAHFENVDGSKMEGDTLYGMAARQFPIIVIKPGLKGKVRANVIYHEIAHHLWPWRKHWWIEAFAEKMARGGGKGLYCNKYGRSVADLPSREVLLSMAIQAGQRFKKRLKPVHK